MQIDCPNCDARYDISENITLEIEHILQCTNCLEIWKYTFRELLTEKMARQTCPAC